jgi:hypothetical protein
MAHICIISLSVRKGTAGGAEVVPYGDERKVIESISFASRRVSWGDWFQKSIRRNKLKIREKAFYPSLWFA